MAPCRSRTPVLCLATASNPDAERTLIRLWSTIPSATCSQPSLLRRLLVMAKASSSGELQVPAWAVASAAPAVEGPRPWVGESVRMLVYEAKHARASRKVSLRAASSDPRRPVTSATAPIGSPETSNSVAANSAIFVSPSFRSSSWALLPGLVSASVRNCCMAGIQNSDLVSDSGRSPRGAPLVAGIPSAAGVPSTACVPPAAGVGAAEW